MLYRLDPTCWDVLAVPDMMVQVAVLHTDKRHSLQSIDEASRHGFKAWLLDIGLNKLPAPQALGTLANPLAARHVLPISTI